MRRYLAGIGVVLATGLGLFFVSSGPPPGGGKAVGIGRIQRFGGRAVPRPTSNCIAVTGSATNYATYSQELDNGAWSSFADVTAPTVTPNAAVAAPACADVVNIAGCGQTGVVDRVQFPATGIGHFSAIRNIHAGPGGGGQWDEYIYAIAGPGGCPDGLDIGSSDTEYFFTHHAIGASWVRISDVAGASTAAGSTLHVGNLGQNVRPTVGGVIGVVARAACDVYLWQADANVQGDEHRPVKTTSAPATQGPGCY